MELIITLIQNEIVQTVLKIVVLIFLMIVPLAALLTLMERKWSALIQDRIGPNRANIGKLRIKGVFHIIADGIKSIFKEDFVAKGTNKLLFTLAPYFSFFAALIVFAVIPIAAPLGDFKFQIADVDSGMLFLLAFSSLGVYGAVLAGWSTNNKYGLLGSVRSSAQMISYEVFLGLSLVGLFLVYGSLRISDIVAGQNEYWLNGWIPKWGIFVQPLAFLLFFTAMIAETKRAPFDAPEGESEIIAERHETLADKLYIPAILKGLRLTMGHFFSNLFSPKNIVTISYPEQKRPVSPRWRGRHRLTRRDDGFLKCVACYMCETVCPANCIYIEAAEHPDKSVEKYPRIFDIDELRCIYCGLCVEACPKDAIRMDTGIIGLSFTSRSRFDYTRNMLMDSYSPHENTKYADVPLPANEREALPNSVGKPAVGRISRNKSA
ncbi:hypothetical protein CHS0354_035298 [Potamilus streckersoni]|uniref:NADH-ubiquinone oxidoreductase chain 1 n=1 Tax=Potamilus streckersoni TaxID=2493646 RepID=A0AAE0S2R6_9BIVA|nr:hypothetical protein CHS0354_035298 [Potamilus streckersoni]